MHDVLNAFATYKIVPVVTVHSAADAQAILGGLQAGGLPVAEICFRTDCAEQALRIAAEKFPSVLVGAGTVLSEEQCNRALQSGARFIVSPGLSAEVANLCARRGVPYFPGVVTPAEVMQALRLGLTHLKFFPAAVFGGTETLRAYASAFPQAAFMPTGGVSLANVREYLALSNVFACGGSWLAKGDAAQIEQAARAAVTAAQGG